MQYPLRTEKWCVFEVSCEGISEGNPFTERTIRATFTGTQECVNVDGFYDGAGIYKVRFMPSFEGDYSFVVSGNYAVEDKQEGRFSVYAPRKGNHGPVRVANQFHFAYEDGTPYYSIGTTCYVWNLQSDEQIAQTLLTLKESAFNKIRFCVFPKHYDYNLGEPISYPYEGTPMDSGVLTKDNFLEYNFRTDLNDFDYTRFHPEHFRHIEWCIMQLQDLGIEADVIMMHPYDRWGFSTMTREQEDRERHLHFWQQKQESGTALEKYRAEQMAEITAGGPIPYEVKELTQAVLQEAWLQENGTVRFIFLSGTADFG